MISHLIAKNVKCFDYQEFELAPLTIFCGANSAGKSTAIQCILLLRQSSNANSFELSEISLIGEYFSVGHVSDLVSHSVQERELSIQLDGLKFLSDLYHVDQEGYQLPFAKLDAYDHAVFKHDFVYLSAERLGPRNSYEVNYDSKELDVGVFGEYAMAEFVKRASFSAVNQELVKIACHEASTDASETDVKFEALTLEIAVKTVMRKICPGFDIQYESHKTVDRVSSTFSSNSTKKSVRPINSGFGVSYAFPIVVAAFSIGENGTFILENPEVHLHPQAQSELANFLAQLSLTGVQVIIETHSDHILNGMRLFSKQNTIQKRHILINSIGKSARGREVKTIEIDADGNLSDFHEGLFDQVEKDLLKLF